MIQHHIYMAGALQNLGNNMIGVFSGWAKPALECIGAIIVVVKIVQRFSLKAGIGTLILLVICLGVYQDRDQLGAMFANELQAQSHGAGQLHTQVLPLPEQPGRAR